jgi:hypothetical protein
VKQFACLILILPAASALAGEPLPNRSGTAVKTSQCAAYGPGFVPVEGTTTCVKISGYVRAEYSWNSASLKGTRFTSSADLTPPSPPNTGAILPTGTSHVGHTGTLAGGAVSLDARMPTSAGTARAYLRVRADQLNGAISPGDAR